MCKATLGQDRQDSIMQFILRIKEPFNCIV